MVFNEYAVIMKNTDRRLFTILLIVFVGILGGAMILPILPLYAQREFALSPQSVSLLVSSFFAAQFLSGPYLGRLSDKYGRVPVLVISQIGTAISFVMLALAPNAGFLFFARVLDGVTGGNIIVAQAYITDITPRQKRTEALGYIFAVFGIGFIVGPALGGLLSAAFGPRVPYLIAAGAAVLTVILTWLTLDETVTEEKRQENRNSRQVRLSLTDLLRNTPLLLILAAAFIGQFGMGMLMSTFALFGDAVLFRGYPTELRSLGVGLLLAVVGVGQFFTQAFLLRKASRVLGDAALVILGSLLRSAGMLILAIALSPWLGAAGSLFFAIGMGLMMPPLQSLSTHTVPDQRRGWVLGVYQSVISLAIIISTAIAGSIFAAHPTYPYWIGGILTLLVPIPAAILARLIPVSRAGVEEGRASTD
jgi:DHA1 family tetracycline resistance protein-like MFS transporter